MKCASLGITLWTLMVGAMLALVGCRAHQGPPLAVGKSALPVFVEQWSQPLRLERGDAVTAVHNTGGLIIIYTESNKVRVYNPDGTFAFSAQMAPRNARVNPPVVLKDAVVFPTVSSLECYALDGRLIKSVRLEAPARSPAVGDRFMVYLGVDEPTGGRLAAIQPLAEGRTQKWSRMIGRGHVTHRPALFQAQIFAGTDAGRVIGSNESADPIWGTASEAYSDRNAAVLGAPVTADLAADETGVYVATKDAKLLCLSANDGLTKWTFYTQSIVRSAPTLTATTVYVDVPARGLAAIDKTPPAGAAFRQEVRTPRWELPGVHQMLCEDAANTYVAIPRARSGLSIGAVNRANGELRKETAQTSFVAFATNPKTAVIYAVTARGNLVAIAPSLKPVAESVTQIK